MKTALLAGLIAIVLTNAHLAHAQVLNDDVGVPLGGTWNTGSPTVVVSEAGTEGQITSIADPNFEHAAITSALPGDLVIANFFVSNDRNDRSDWIADIRFFNPLDPTGSLGLPATETEAFFPDDLGPAGFDAFQLFPNYNVIQGGTAPNGWADGTEDVSGPLGGVLGGQLATIIVVAYPELSAAGTPEPGGLALLFGVGVVGAGLVARRRWQAQTTNWRTL